MCIFMALTNSWKSVLHLVKRTWRYIHIPVGLVGVLLSVSSDNRVTFCTPIMVV